MPSVAPLIRGLLRREPVRFLLAGGAGYSLNIGVFAFLVEGVGVHHLLAACASFIGAWLSSFALHRYWTFAHSRAREPLFTQGLRYLGVALISLVLNLALLELLVSGLHLMPVLAQLISVATVVPVSFVLTRRWSFGVDGPAA